MLLVVDAMTGQDAVGVAESFAEAAEFDGVVMTKLDGDARGGAALSVKAVTGKPIMFASTGEKIEDFDKFHPDRMAQRILGMGDVLSLIERAESQVDEKSAEELEEKLKKDQFTLEDFLTQMRQVRKMGPLSGILGMLPGMGAMKQLKNANIDERELDRTEAIILSDDPGRARRSAPDQRLAAQTDRRRLRHESPRGPRPDLPEFKRIKNALGGTVNDVSLAVATGALRAWFAEREVATDGVELKALVPVSIRTVDEHGELGNKLTAMRGPLPVGIADPAERLAVISTAMDDLKASKQPLGAEAIWGLNDWFRDFAPPVLLGPTAAINFSTRLFNLLVTNFPGPQIPFYALGRELTAIHPVGFLARRHGLAIAILSYNGRVSFGLLADPDSAPGAERLAVHLESAVAELSEAADRAAPPLASPGDGDHLAGDDRPRFARARERRAARGG